MAELRLTAAEEAMLAGAEGPGVRRAMEIVVALGRIYGAAHLAPIVHAHIAGVSYKNLGDAGVAFLADWAAEGARVRVPTTLNPMGMERGRWQAWGLPASFAHPQLSVMDAFVKMGVTPTLSCTPYLFPGFTPRRNDLLAWAESSAVAFANSVIAARSNRDGGSSALAAAIAGRTAAYGYLLDENRRADYVVEVRCPVRSVADFGALSYLVGKAVGNGTPWFADLAEWLGTPPRPPEHRCSASAVSPADQSAGYGAAPDQSGLGPAGDSPAEEARLHRGAMPRQAAPGLEGESWGRGDGAGDRLKTLAAGLAAYGAVALYHVAGYTPEARDAGEALIRPDARRIVIADLAEAHRVMYADPDLRTIDLVTIGCPHASLAEIGQVAEFLAGKTLATRLWVTTGEITRRAATNLGYVQAIEAAGGEVVADTCAVVAPMHLLGVHTMATNAGKMACYAPMHSGVRMRFGDLERCLMAAVTGEW